LIRVWIVLLGAAIFFTCAAVIHQATPKVEHIANGMLGENWYRIQLGADHVGYMYNHLFVDDNGRRHFRSTTHFQLDAHTPNTISKHLIFAAKPPYALLEAEYRNRSGAQTDTTTLSKTTAGLLAQISRGNTSSTLQLDWQYGLEDFLGFEHWLATAAPDAGAQHTTASPDFEKLRIVARPYRVLARKDHGYLVETNALLAPTQTQLDLNYQPLKLNMAGVFEVERTTETQAIALRALKHKTQYLFPIDSPLHDHQQISRLHLRLKGGEPFNLPDLFELQANPIISQGDPQQYMGEAMDFPITHPAVQKLVQTAMSKNFSDQPIQALVDITRQQLQYAENYPAGSVLKALNDGRGECTDFADLMTTLARAAGLPARTVYSLAYQHGANPAFLFHAWNEVYVDSRWQAVDPTWNQTQVDATHIPLSHAQAAQMMLANRSGDLTFELLALDYFAMQ